MHRSLKWAVVILFLAFAWEYWRWGSPVRSLLWDEDLFSPVATLLGWQWADWVSSPVLEQWIRTATLFCVFIFLAAAIISLFYPTLYKKTATVVLLFSVCILFLQAVLKTKSHFWQLGQMMELSLQWLSPVLLLLAYSEKYRSSYLEWSMRLLIAATFIGHGLYAIGFYPVPGHFSDMMINGLGMTNSTALQSLFVVGWLDIIAAVILLIPGWKWIKPALVYIIIWGFLTAIARLWSYAPYYTLEQLSVQWLSESGSRWVHFLVPISLFFYLKERKEQVQHPILTSKNHANT